MQTPSITWTYRGTLFRARNLDTQGATAAIAFLREQPELTNASLSISDFERLWHAFKLSFKAPYTIEPSSQLLNFEETRLQLQNGQRFRWSASGIPINTYFIFVFTFFQRRASVYASTTVKDARRILNQPPTIELHRCTYLSKSWFCFTLPSAVPGILDLLQILQRTIAFQTQAWSIEEFHLFWQTVQYVAATDKRRAEIRRFYADQLWQRTIDSHLLITAAELLHFLHRHHPMDLQAFLQCFDTCLLLPAASWTYHCQTLAARIEALATACQTTAREVHPYQSDAFDTSHEPAYLQRHRSFSQSATQWPGAVPSLELRQHLASGRASFIRCMEAPAQCTFCACPTPAHQAILLDLRHLHGGCLALHPLLSGQAYVLRNHARFADHLPITFLGLTWDDLKDICVPLPVELRAHEPATWFQS